MLAKSQQTLVVKASPTTRCCLCGSTPTDAKHARMPAIGFVILSLHVAMCVTQLGAAVYTVSHHKKRIANV